MGPADFGGRAAQEPRSERASRGGAEAAERRAVAKRLREIYRLLRQRFGPGRWWPAKTRFEVCVGAILTQNTAWRNVERALGTLRSRGRLSYAGLRAVPAHRLASWIRSSGFYRVKARRLGAFVRFLGAQYGGRVHAMSRDDPQALRQKLLAVRGIGPETADSILLYAVGVPTFVVDAYTRRIFARLGFLSGGESYDAVQELFTRHLARDVALFNDYHAQIVALGKAHCRVRPECAGCPLEPTCPKRGIPRDTIREV